MTAILIGNQVPIMALICARGIYYFNY